MQRSPVLYAKSGDLHIAYQVVGKGPVDVVHTPGAISHLDLWWDCPYFVRYFERLASFSRLILFDKRGTGLSDRPTDYATLEERIDDIRAVMDAAESERAHIFGLSEGGSMACLFAATYPQRTRSLILYGTKPRWIRARDYPWGRTDEEREAGLQRLQAAGWERDVRSTDMRRWFGAPVRDDPAFLEWFTRQRRIGATPAAQIALSRMNAMIDIRDIVPSIRVPTLVLNRTGDPAVEVEAARDLARRIPGARFIEFPGEGHLFFDIWEDVVSVIEEWVTTAAAPVATERFLATILFVDIVRSTERVAELGDAAWRDLLARYYVVARRELALYGGREVDTAGDGLLGTFDGPARAIRCARAIQREGTALGLTLRAGIHTGEVERSNGAVRGIAVHLAARIAAIASPGEIYVSSTVRDLVAGSGLAFEDRGVHELKGISEPRQVLAVASA